MRSENAAPLSLKLAAGAGLLFMALPILLIFVYIWLPYMIIPVQAALERVPGNLIEASYDLGGAPGQTFRYVLFPLALPGIIAGTVLAFARSLGEFGATITFVSAIPGETQTLASAISAALQDPDGEPEAWRLTVLSILISFAAIFLSGLVSRFVARRVGTLP